MSELIAPVAANPVSATLASLLAFLTSAASWVSAISIAPSYLLIIASILASMSAKFFSALGTLFTPSFFKSALALSLN